MTDLTYTSQAQGLHGGALVLIVPASEGEVASLTAGETANFTFSLPPGKWTSARLDVYALGIGNPASIYVGGFRQYINGARFVGTSTLPGQPATSFSGILENASPKVFGQALSAGAGGISAAAPLAVIGNGGGNGFGPPEGITPGGRTLSRPILSGGAAASASLTVTPPGSGSQAQYGNNADTKLTRVNAAVTLYSVVPVPPTVLLTVTTSQSDDGKPPYTGTAKVQIVPSGPVTQSSGGAPAAGSLFTDGVPPLTYTWQYPDNAALVPDTDTITWQYNDPISPGQNSTGLGVACIVSNGRLPLEPTSPYLSPPLPGVTQATTPPNDLASTTVASQMFYYSGPPSASVAVTPPGAYSLAEDGHRRPALLSSGSVIANTYYPTGAVSSSINGLVSKDAGKNYGEVPLSDNAAAGYVSQYLGGDTGFRNPSLLIDRRSNHFRAFYDNGYNALVRGVNPFTNQGPEPAQVLMLSGPMDDRFSAGAGNAAPLPGISGGLCVAAQHPTDENYALLVYSDTGTKSAPGSHDLKSAYSLDAGATWTALGTVLPALDLSKTGRPALCFIGSVAVLAYSAGNTLYALTSRNRGQSWTAPAPVSTYRPKSPVAGVDYGNYGYWSLSLAAHQGQVYLLAFAGDTQAAPQPPPQYSPRLWVSGNLGKDWTLQAAEVYAPTQYKTASVPVEFAVPPPGKLPGLPGPCGIGASEYSGLLRLGISYTSADGGLTWTAA